MIASPLFFKGRLKNFNKLKTNRADYLEFGYDYDSIMHYGPYYFSRDKSALKQTIVPLRRGARIGQRRMLSKTDCMRLNHHFGCFDVREPWRNYKIQVLCGMLGFSYEDEGQEWTDRYSSGLP